MKHIYLIFLAAAFGLTASAQTPAALKISVKAENERFYAGPYAKYAAKYLGVDACQTSGASTSLTSVSIVPEPAGPKGELSCSFGKSAGDRADFSSAPLLKSSVGLRSVEMAASQAADLIMTIRQKRHQILTGDTDMSLSGETLRLTLEEFARQEKELLKLFLGYKVVTELENEFTVIPKKDDESRLYVAFRISDNGIFPAEHLEGRMVTLEVVPQNLPEKASSGEPAQSGVKKAPKGMVWKEKSEFVPAECGVKLRDGVNAILQGTLVVPQLGYERVYVELVPAEK